MQNFCTPRLISNRNCLKFETKQHILVNNTNLPILHHFQVIANIGQIFASNRVVPHFNAFTGGDPLRISGWTLPLQKLEWLSYLGLELPPRMPGISPSLVTLSPALLQPKPSQQGILFIPGSARLCLITTGKAIDSMFRQSVKVCTG